MIKFYPSGVRAYLDINNNFHRENGPAYISPTSIEYFIHGKRHRIDGPAIKLIFIYDKDYWYYDGKYVPVNSQEEFERYIKLLVFI